MWLLANSRDPRLDVIGELHQEWGPRKSLLSYRGSLWMFFFFFFFFFFLFGFGNGRRPGSAHKDFRPVIRQFQELQIETRLDQPGLSGERGREDEVAHARAAARRHRAGSQRG